jgi:tRNA(fMet)-specific endonuclease VapC
MILHVLDTDHISLFQRKHPTVVQNMVSADPNQLAVSIVTVEEQIKGHFKLIKQANSGAKLIRAYAALQSGVAYFNTITVLPFDEVANAHYETLRKQKIRIGTQDLRIAAIVLSVKGILVTRNWKDFAKVPDLTLEDWSIS